MLLIPGHRVLGIWRCRAQIRPPCNCATTVVVHPGGWSDPEGPDRGGKQHLPRRQPRRIHNGGLTTMQTLEGDKMNHIYLRASQTWRLSMLLLVAFGLVTGVPITAQSGRGTLTGIVNDANGSVVPGASLNLTETNTGSKYDGATTSDGLFSFPELPPGTYALEINATGFESFNQVGIVVQVASTSTVTAQLKVGSAQTTVTVTSDASHLESESSDVGFTMLPQVLDSLPLPFGGEIRNPLEFAALSPGFAGSMTNNPSSPPSGNFKLSGGQQGGGDILLDGSTTELASANMQVTYGFSVEAVSEFKVMTNTFDAQFGSASGGVVNLSSKQGTNTFHGSAYDLLKNRVIDANSWLNNYQHAV